MNEESDRAGEAAAVPDLWMSLQELEEGTLPPDQRDELMRRLESSAAAREAYVEYFHQSAVFKMEGAKLHEQGLLPVADLSHRSRRLFQRSILAAAAVIIVLGIVATLIVVKQPEPAVLSASVAAETRWTVDGELQTPDGEQTTVTEGAMVEVLSGTVRLDLESGAVMALQGPARVTFPSLQRPVLSSGWLWIDTAGSGEAFAVQARGLVVRDVGTRFGVRVPERGPVEVHLVEGKVEVLKINHTGPALTLLPDGRGQAVRPDREPEPLDLAPDPFPGLADLLAAEANYRTTVMSQTPVGYWTLDDAGDQGFANAVAESAPAGSGTRIATGEPGPGRDEGFRGFDAANRSVRLTGDPDKSVLLDLDGGRGVSRREGAVAFWIRRPSGLQSGEMLWLAGETYSGRLHPEQAILFTELTASGHVSFSIENGKFDVTLTSSRSITDDRWHHIAANWGPSAVELYIDGKRIARDADSRILQEGTFTGRYVRFGKPSTDLRIRQVQPFGGWVDEMALWSRPLTHAEVTQQFQSARGR